jgi:transposase
MGELDTAIGAILEEVAPLLLEEKCVSSQGTVQLMIRVGDNPERLKQRVVVLLCGVAARPVSSGLTTLHRLNRGAGRAANSAIHIVAPGRLRTDERIHTDIARKMSKGHSKLEAIRCVKRYIARELYYDIIAQSRMLKTT